MAKIGIVGLGYVGAANAYSIVTQGICSELYLYDIKQDLALAHARDLEDWKICQPFIFLIQKFFMCQI